MKINDYLSNGSIFAPIIKVFNAVSEDHIFSVMTAQEWDDLLMIKYGDRWTVDRLVQYGDRMLESFARMNIARYDVLNGIGSIDSVLILGDKKITIEEYKGNDLSENSSDDLEKVSAFNDDELIVDKGRELIGNSKGEKEYNRTVTETNGDLLQMRERLQLLEDSNIIDIVLNDVAKFVALSIY